ncbi:invasion associated locus B family protein [Mesorhizobium sp. KR9-304]|uniref:invasion associated locus B family protein n=1 Tax=Mesorhizobium sp. KR9-304 TaxID=3156614 RepID=UPI0032B385B0
MRGTKSGRLFLAAVVGVAALGAIAISGALGTSIAPAETVRDRPAEVKVAQAAAKETRKSAEGNTSTTVTTTTVHEGWTVTCNEGGAAPAKMCSASFRVINKQNNAVVLVWLMGRNAAGKPLAEFLTPTDVSIQPGIAVAFEESKPVKADYVSCTKKGCKASLDLTNSLVGQMKTAKKAKIDITLVDGKIVQFSVDIPGIDKALTDLGL